MKYIFYGVVVVLCVDLLGAIAWKTSGQKPVDSFHAGIVTESILKAF